MRSQNIYLNKRPKYTWTKKEQENREIIYRFTKSYQWKISSHTDKVHDSIRLANATGFAIKGKMLDERYNNVVSAGIL